MRETGLTPANDKMPIDQGISQELPDPKDPITQPAGHTP